MNKATVEIAEYVAKHFGSCDLELARRLQDHMAVIQQLDFSECSRQEFNDAIRTAHVAVSRGWELSSKFWLGLAAVGSASSVSH